MTIAAQGSIVSFAKQAGKVGDGGVFDPDAVEWFRFRAPRFAMGVIEDTQRFPMETGGPLVLEGTFKQQSYFGGEVELIPRMENSFGLLLLGAMGVVSSVTGVDAYATPTVGVNTHLFYYDPADHSATPWLAARRMIPGKTTAENSGQSGFDGKITSMRFTIPAMGKIGALVRMYTRDFLLDDSADWVYEGALEDPTSTPDVGGGFLKLGGAEYPIVGLTVDVTNSVSTPGQEAIVGSYHPDDPTVLSRDVTIRLIYKYESDDLERLIQTGDPDGTNWSPLPYEIETTGGVLALEGYFPSPRNIPGTSTPYSFHIRCNKITMMPEGPVEPVAGGILTQTFVVTMLRPESGNPLDLLMVNAVESY
jgi:hypothetical protein